MAHKTNVFDVNGFCANEEVLRTDETSYVRLRHRNILASKSKVLMTRVQAVVTSLFALKQTFGRRMEATSSSQRAATELNRSLRKNFFQKVFFSISVFAHQRKEAKK